MDNFNLDELMDLARPLEHESDEVEKRGSLRE